MTSCKEIDTPSSDLNARHSTHIARGNQKNSWLGIEKSRGQVDTRECGGFSQPIEFDLELGNQNGDLYNSTENCHLINVVR